MRGGKGRAAVAGGGEWGGGTDGQVPRHRKLVMHLQFDALHRMKEMRL